MRPSRFIYLVAQVFAVAFNMKKQILKIAALLVLTVMSTACSNQWREADESVSGEDAFAFVNEFTGQVAALSGITENLNSVVYYAQSGEASGLPESVMSFGDVSFLGAQGSVFDMQLNSVTVALVDTFVGEERQFSLLIKYDSATFGAQSFAVSSADFSINEDKFEVVFEANGQTLLLRSYDIDDRYSDELDTSIHLKAYLLDPSGNETPIGQFSALRGFSG